MLNLPHEKEVYFDRWCNSREVGTDFEKLRQVILIEEFKRCVCDDIKTYLDEQKVENLAKAVKFAHEKEVYFDRWCNSREVGTDFEKLRQVILIEEFKRCVCDDIKTYLDEQKVENLAKAAAFADDYALTHKSTFNKTKSFGPAKKSYPEVGKKSENVPPEKSSDKGQTSNQTVSKDRKPRSFAPVCHYCKKLGHVMSDCLLLKKRREKEATPNAFGSSKSNWCLNPNRAESSIGLDKSEIIREEFKPFVS